MYLGIDLGTSEVKVVLLSDRHQLLATQHAALPISRPQSGWSEQDPQHWWDATCQAVAALRAEQPSALAQVRAVGLSGQMHGAVLLGQRDEVLRPAILWNDVRSAPQCVQLTQRMPSLAAIAGNLAMPGFTAPKLAWVEQHEPAVFVRVRKVLLPKDYLRLRMTGTHISEMSDAAGTLWLDVARRDWSDELLALTGLTRAHMPALVEGSAVSALLSADVAREWGLPGAVPVAGGGGDNAASAVGIGAVNAGDGFISLGTSGVLFVVTDRFRPNPASAVHAFCHALPARWHQMSVMLSAASCLRWVTQLVGAPDEATLLAQVQANPPHGDEHVPLFLPYLSGERTPHNDAHARGVLFGMDHDTSAAALAHSVLEGVALGMLDGLEALRAAGTDVKRLALVGGGARSDYWAQLHADALQVEVVTLAGGEAGGALGAARLAWLADGGSEAEVCRSPAVMRAFEPDPQRGAVLHRRHQRFKALYRAVRHEFAAMATP